MPRRRRTRGYQMSENIRSQDGGEGFKFGRPKPRKLEALERQGRLLLVNHGESPASAIAHLVGAGIGARAPETAEGVAGRVCAARNGHGASR